MSIIKLGCPCAGRKLKTARPDLMRCASAALAGLMGSIGRLEGRSPSQQEDVRQKSCLLQNPKPKGGHGIRRGTSDRFGFFAFEGACVTEEAGAQSRPHHASCNEGRGPMSKAKGR